MGARGIASIVAALLLGWLSLAAAPARGDWNGDAKGDVLAVGSDGALLLYAGNGAGGFLTSTGRPIGSGWGAFTALLAPGDFSGDGKHDLLARRSDGALLMYRGNGTGGFLTGAAERIGAGWAGFTALLAPGDFTGDGKADLLARKSDGALMLYPGNGAGGFLVRTGQRIGAGWADFTALLAPGDFSGDGKADILARGSDGALLMYRGNAAGGFLTGAAEPIGSGWGSFTALVAGGDFSGDGKADILARRSDGVLLMYRGNGAGGFLTGTAEPIGAAWNSLSALMLDSGPAPPPPPAPPPAPPAPPSAPLQDGRVKLTAGIRCTPPGGRLKVNLRIRRRAGRPPARVRRVVFFVRRGPRRVDRRKPYVVRLRMNRPAGERGRVHARVFFRRAGSRKLRHKTVSRRFRMCG